MQEWTGEKIAELEFVWKSSSNLLLPLLDVLVWEPEALVHYLDDLIYRALVRKYDIVKIVFIYKALQAENLSKRSVLIKCGCGVPV